VRPELGERPDLVEQPVGPAQTSVQLVDLFDREHEPTLPHMSDRSVWTPSAIAGSGDTPRCRSGVAGPSPMPSFCRNVRYPAGSPYRRTGRGHSAQQIDPAGAGSNVMSLTGQVSRIFMIPSTGAATTWPREGLSR
jgi:hypothetical protein